jgi:hypothetical protein
MLGGYVNPTNIKTFDQGLMPLAIRPVTATVRRQPVIASRKSGLR